MRADKAEEVLECITGCKCATCVAIADAVKSGRILLSCPICSIKTTLMKGILAGIRKLAIGKDTRNG